MKLRRIISVAVSAAMLSAAFTGCGSAEKNNSEESDVNKVVMESSNVKTLGRTYLQDETLWLALSGSGVDFNYTGKDLNITLCGDGASEVADNTDNYARVGIYVDGERVIDDMIDEKEKTYDVFTGDESKTVNVKIVKLSETAMSTVGIEPVQLNDGDKIEPTEEKTHKIEFIGDSITCGYGVDDEDKDHHFSTTTEDVTKTYAYKTAQALDADYSMFSVSGYDIISGYTDNGNAKSEQTIPQYYESLGFSYNSFDGITPQSLSWDFSQFVPDVIVINLGTNDDSYVENDDDKGQEFIDAYVEFLKEIRADNPDAKIFCTVGIMGTRIYSRVEQAYITYARETGDRNIEAFRFDAQNGNEDGYAADWHPTEATHEKAAEALTEEIKSVMGW